MDPASLNSSPEGGVPIVLTASWVEMSDFELDPFVAFGAALPLGFIPRPVLRRFFYPPVAEYPDRTTRFAPYGLRKIQAVLERTFGTGEVALVHPRRLGEFIGPRTRVVGISGMDPAGQGFVSRTLSGLLGWGGTSTTTREFDALLSHPIIKRWRPRVLVGGSGAWQLVENGSGPREPVDGVVLGEAEKSVVDIVKKAMDGAWTEYRLMAEPPQSRDIPAISQASIYGTVEITRGCGRGCHFCSPNSRKPISFPLEHILEEVRVNAAGGSRMITLQTDDLFLYHTRANFSPNVPKVVELIEKAAGTRGVEFVQVAHASLPPVLLEPDIIKEIGPILVEKSIYDYQGRPCASMELGIETGSVSLIKKYMQGKPLPFSPEHWPDLVVRGVEIMNRCRIYPLATLILGLPGEVEQDVEATLRLMERLEHLGIFYVPLLFVSEEGTTLRGRRHQEADQLGTLHWEVCFRCWRHNLVNWSPGFYRLARLAECFSMKWRVRALFTAFAASKSMERGKRRTRLRKKVR